MYGLYYVGSLYAHFWRVLIINECWILSKAFSASIDIITWLLSSNLLIWCVTLIDLHILKNPHIPGIKPTLIMVYEPLDVLLNCLLKFCWGFLHLCSSVILACSFIFLCCLCLVLVSGWWWLCRMSVEVFLPLQLFETVLGWALALLPDSSVGKESACNAGDPGSIPGLGRSPGEGIGYPLQCSWASLMAQLVKNLPSMWET